MQRQDLPVIRNLAFIYTLAGADCIDVAAEEAVIAAARCPGLACSTVIPAHGRGVTSELSRPRQCPQASPASTRATMLGSERVALCPWPRLQTRPA